MLWASVWGLRVGLQNLKDEDLPEEEKAVGEESSCFQQEEQHG